MEAVEAAVAAEAGAVSEEGSEAVGDPEEAGEAGAEAATEDEEA